MPFWLSTAITTTTKMCIRDRRRIVQLDIADAEQVGLILPDQSGKALFRAFIRGNLHRRFTSLHLIDETAGRFVRFFEKKEAIYFHHAPIISCAQ